MPWKNNWSRDYAASFYQKATMLLYFFLLAPIWGPLAAWYFLAAKNSKSVMALAGGTAALSAAVAWFFSRITAPYMAVEEMSFRRAAAHTFYPVLARLAVLPVVGGLFRRFLSAPKNPEDANPRISSDARIPDDAIVADHTGVEKGSKAGSKRVEW